MDNDFEEDVVEFNSCGKSLGSSEGSVSIGSKPKKQKTNGRPIDVFFTPNPDVVVQNCKPQGKRKETKIDGNDLQKEELREEALIRFTRWMYDASMSFNAMNYDNFGPTIEAIEQYGHVADGWIDKKGRTLINFLVNCQRGTMFVESVDASSYSKDGQKMFELLDKFVELVREANVVQIVTDTAASNVLADSSTKNNLKKMFTLEDWTSSKWAKEQQGKRVAQIRLMPSFWNSVVHAIKVFGPFAHILRLVDTEEKISMQYV
ncbi:hypothetical protein ACSBR2_020615 [Camellia fascicularis]